MLPEDVYCDSTTGPPGFGSRDPKKRTKRKGSKGGSSAAAASAFSSIASKNNAMEMKIHNESRTLCRQNLVREKKEKRALEKELAEHCQGGKSEAKDRVKRYKEAVEEDEDIEESQESAIQDIIDAEEEIAMNQAEIDKIDILLRKFE